MFTLVLTLLLGAPLEWPRAALDAENGPAGVMLTTDTHVRPDDVQWDLSPSCLHSGKMGYRVVVAKPPARPDDAVRAILPE